MWHWLFFIIATIFSRANMMTTTSQMPSTSKFSIDDVNEPVLGKLYKLAPRFLAPINSVSAVTATVA